MTKLLLLQKKNSHCTFFKIVLQKLKKLILVLFHIPYKRYRGRGQSGRRHF